MVCRGVSLLQAQISETLGSQIEASQIAADRQFAREPLLDLGDPPLGRGFSRGCFLGNHNRPSVSLESEQYGQFRFLLRAVPSQGLTLQVATGCTGLSGLLRRVQSTLPAVAQVSKRLRNQFKRGRYFLTFDRQHATDLERGLQIPGAQLLKAFLDQCIIPVSGQQLHDQILCVSLVVDIPLQPHAPVFAHGCLDNLPDRLRRELGAHSEK